MGSITGNEIRKTYLKWRSYIAFIAVAVVVPLVQIGMKLQGESLIKSMTQSVAQDFLLFGNLLNGYFVTYFIMNALWIHVPFLITLGAGDQLAGEATGGTFRLLLIQPASRHRILLSKYVTTLLYTFTVVFFLGLLALGLGVLMFGTGDLLVLGRGLTILPKADALGRIVFAFVLATWGMWSVASLAFLFSSLVENGIGPIIGTMSVIIVFYVISGIPVELFRAMKPYIFTTYLNIWQKAMEPSLPWGEIATSAAILGGFSIGFYLVSWYIFVRKDILS